MTGPESSGLAQVQDLVLDLLLELDRVCRVHDLRYFLAYGTLLGAVREQRIIPWDIDADVWVLGEDLDRLESALHEDLDARFELLTPSSHADYEYLFPRLVVRGVHHVYLRVDLFPLDPAPGRAWTRRLYIGSTRLLCRVWFVKRADTSVRHHYSARKRLATRLLKLFAIPLSEAWVLRLFRTVRTVRTRGRATDQVVSSCGSYGLREYLDRSAFDRPTLASLGGSEFAIPSASEALLAGLYGTWRVPVPEAQQVAQLAAAERDVVEPLRAMGLVR